MVTNYIKVSISIKQEDKEEYNEFIDIASKDKRFQIKRNKGTKAEPKMVIEFEGVSSVFNKLWKLYLKKKKEELGISSIDNKDSSELESNEGESEDDNSN